MGLLFSEFYFYLTAFIEGIDRAEHFENADDPFPTIYRVDRIEKLQGLDGQVFLDETEDAYCVWRAEYSKRSRICSYFMDIFRLDEESGLWERGEELHRERSYEPQELVEYLTQAGFQDIRQFGNLKMRAPKPGEDRIFFTARKNPKLTTQI